MQSGITRRKAVTSLGAAAAGMFLGRPARASVPAPTAPVAVGKSLLATNVPSDTCQGVSPLTCALRAMAGAAVLFVLTLITVRVMLNVIVDSMMDGMTRRKK